LAHHLESHLRIQALAILAPLEPLGRAVTGLERVVYWVIMGILGSVGIILAFATGYWWMSIITHS